MLEPMHCECGQRIEAKTTFTGFAYVIEFFPGLGEPAHAITHCPRCDIGLYEALRNGQLEETRA